MASGWVQSNRGKYAGVVRRDDGTKVTKTYHRKRDARAWVDETLTDVRRNEYVHPRDGNFPFGELLDEFEANSIDLRPSTAARNKSVIENHLRPKFGTKRVNAISQRVVQSWVNDLSKTLKASTVRKSHELLKRVLQDAVDSKILKLNPCLRTRLPKIEDSSPRFLSPAEVSKLAQMIAPRYRALVLLAAYSGLRIGELAGLRVRCVDLAAPLVEVKEIAVEVRGRVIIGNPKTRSSLRRVPIPRQLALVLQKHIAEHTDGKPDTFVFQGAQGGVLRARAWRSRHFVPAVQAAGLAPLRPHDLRHTAASIWIFAGVQQKELSDRLGHSSIVMTDRYGHLFPASDAAFGDRVAAVFAP